MNKKIIMLGLGVAISSAAFASGPAVVSITGGTAFTSYWGSVDGDVIGYGVTTGSDAVMVTALGFWIDADGATSDHMVGLWDAGTGVLMTSANVGVASGFDQTGWHYNNVSAVALDINTRYVAGALYTPTDGDSYISSNTGLVMDTNMTHTGAKFAIGADLGFVMPTGDSVGNNGRHGPNFITAPVPEPATMAVLGLGVAALVRKRRRKA